MLKRLALLAALATPFIAAAPAQAAAPMVKTQAPGFYRIMLGDFEITALSDGSFDLPVDKLLKEPPAKTDAALKRNFLTLPVQTSVNAYLVNTGARLVLIDTGTGGIMAPTAGTLIANLKAAGYEPEQVDDILITHMHGDHVGGLAPKGKALFPNATVHAGKGDVDYWLSQPAMDKAAEADKGKFVNAMNAFTPYSSAGKLAPIEGDVEVVPGIKALGSPGHTPGHTSYVVESQGQKLIVMGDLIHVAAVQFDDPSVTIGFDSDGKAAAASRARVFAMAAKDGTLVSAAHLQFPGMGHLKAVGSHWQWIPVNYTRMP